MLYGPPLPQITVSDTCCWCLCQPHSSRNIFYLNVISSLNNNCVSQCSFTAVSLKENHTWQQYVCSCHHAGCIPDRGPVWWWPGTRLLCCEQRGSAHWLVRKQHTHTKTHICMYCPVRWTAVSMIRRNCEWESAVDSFTSEDWKTWWIIFHNCKNNGKSYITKRFCIPGVSILV